MNFKYMLLIDDDNITKEIELSSFLKQILMTVLTLVEAWQQQTITSTHRPMGDMAVILKV